LETIFFLNKMGLKIFGSNADSLARPGPCKPMKDDELNKTWSFPRSSFLSDGGAQTSSQASKPLSLAPPPPPQQTSLPPVQVRSCSFPGTCLSFSHASTAWNHLNVGRACLKTRGGWRSSRRSAPIPSRLARRARARQWLGRRAPVYLRFPFNSPVLIGLSPRAGGGT
jgi:hypothetical protein